MDANWLTMAGQMAVLAQEGGAESSTSGALGGAVTGADGSGGAGGPGNSQPTGGGGMPPFLWLMVMMLMVVVIFSMMGGRKEKKKREAMMGALKKHDKVQTIGGIIGVVAEIGADEVVLRVDETSKTRVRFSRSAIQQVLKSGAGSDGGGAGAAEREGSDGAEASAANGMVEKAGV